MVFKTLKFYIISTNSYLLNTESVEIFGFYIHKYEIFIDASKDFLQGHVLYFYNKYKTSEKMDLNFKFPHFYEALILFAVAAVIKSDNQNSL